MTPSDYLLHARLHLLLACQMLDKSSLTTAVTIPRRFGSRGQLAKLFPKYMSTTPTDYHTMEKLPHAHLASGVLFTRE